MQPLLDDLQKDIENLRACIKLMEKQLDELQHKLDVIELQPETKQPETPEAVPAGVILAERIKPASHLRHAMSLNDSFRFARELFEGDAGRMNQMLNRLSRAETWEEAIGMLKNEVQLPEDNEAATDFTELLRKYFN